MLGKKKLINLYIPAGILGALCFYYFSTEPSMNLWRLDSEPEQALTLLELSDLNAEAFTLSNMSVFEKTSVTTDTCDAKCDSALNAMFSDTIIDEENFNILLAYAPSIASLLSDDLTLQSRLMDVLKHTRDINKQNVVIEIFNTLPRDQIETIAFELLESNDWRLKVKARALLANHESMSLAKTHNYPGSLSNRSNPNFERRSTDNLETNNVFANYAKTIGTLDMRMKLDSNESVRSSALRTKMQMTDDPKNTTSNATFAVRSDKREPQLTGLSALEGLLKRPLPKSTSAETIDPESLSQDLEKAFNTTAIFFNAEQAERIATETESIFEEYFEN